MSWCRTPPMAGWVEQTFGHADAGSAAGHTTGAGAMTTTTSPATNTPALPSMAIPGPYHMGRLRPRLRAGGADPPAAPASRRRRRRRPGPAANGAGRPRPPVLVAASKSPEGAQSKPGRVSPACSAKIASAPFALGQGRSRRRGRLDPQALARRGQPRPGELLAGIDLAVRRDVGMAEDAAVGDGPALADLAEQGDQGLELTRRGSRDSRTRGQD